MKPQIILASASIGRKHLLEKLNVQFQVVPSTIDEEAIVDSDPIKTLTVRARAKGEDVCKHLASSELASDATKTKPYTLNPNSYLVIAADSMAIWSGKTFGKAKDKADAKRIISELMGPPALASGKSRWRAGKTHEFVTATHISYLSDLSDLSHLSNQHWENVTSTRITMRSLTEQELDQYTTRYDFTRFAAGYALNETPWDLVSAIEGSYTNVIGLPFEVVLPILRQFSFI